MADRESINLPEDNDPGALPIEVQDRFSWVLHAGFQVTAAAKLLQQQIRTVQMESDGTQAVAISLLIDRLHVLGELITDLGDEEQQDTDDMQRRLCLSVQA